MTYYIQNRKGGNRGRSLVNPVNCLTSKVSRFVDFHLKPIAAESPSYVPD